MPFVNQRRDVIDHAFHAFGQRLHPVAFAAADVEQLLGQPLWEAL
jgi:hypothetical protein